MPIGPVGLLPLLTNGAESAKRPGMFRPLDIASSGLSAQRLRMEVIATNIANAETTHVGEGGPYRRRIVRLEESVREGAPPSYPALPLLKAAICRGSSYTVAGAGGGREPGHGLAGSRATSGRSPHGTKV